MTKPALRFLALLLCLCLLGCSAPVTTWQEAAPTATPTQEAPKETAQPAVQEYPSIPEKAEEPSLQLHYHRTDRESYSKWGFWIWETGGEGKLYELNYEDAFGGVALYPLSAFGADAASKGIGIIPRLLSGWTKDGEGDRLLSFDGLVLDENNYYHVYILEGDMSLYPALTPAMEQTMNQMRYSLRAEFVSEDRIQVTAALPMTGLTLYEGEKNKGFTPADNALSAVISLDILDLEAGYRVEAGFADGTVVEQEVSVNALFDTPAFDALYRYDGELGALYTLEQTVFKVWSPLSKDITLCLYDKGEGGDALCLPMEKGDKGVFSVTVEGDLHGKYYSYKVVNSQYPQGVEIVDPYAKSAGKNGKRGQVVDFARLNPEGWDSWQPYAYDRKALTVYETHVSDVTSAKSWTGSEQYRYKFLGLVEEGTSFTKDGITVTTGFDHIKELGVNAIQLIPIFDQDNEEGKPVFNWGYNPLNYNVLEGSYSTNPNEGTVRIKEFKRLVQKCHEAGINIHMDVVYNHVSAAAGSNFDVLMPGYYFRYNKDGSLSNGSGCGNETASERSMMRKFITDSVCFWAEEYKLGGFRFDLMGLHDLETMNRLTEVLQKINPAIVVYGEPWEGGSTLLKDSLQADQKNANHFVGYGQFNDQFRDALIKSGMNAVSAKGWVTDEGKISQGDVDKLLAGFKGGTKGDGYLIADPDKNIIYATCHDNYTLYDRIKQAGVRDKDTVRKMAVLANAMVFSSQGTSFMLAGEEFLRTKGTGASAGNSYNASYQVNQLDYSRKIEYYEVFELYKKLIAFKQTTVALQLPVDKLDQYQVESLQEGAVFCIRFTQGDREYVIYHGNGLVKDCVLDLEGYTLYLDTLGDRELTDNTLLQPFESLIAYR